MMSGSFDATTREKLKNLATLVEGTWDRNYLFIRFAYINLIVAGLICGVGLYFVASANVYVVDKVAQVILVGASSAILLLLLFRGGVSWADEATLCLYVAIALLIPYVGDEVALVCGTLMMALSLVCTLFHQLYVYSKVKEGEDAPRKGFRAVVMGDFFTYTLFCLSGCGAAWLFVDKLSSPNGTFIVCNGLVFVMTCTIIYTQWLSRRAYIDETSKLYKKLDSARFRECIKSLEGAYGLSKRECEVFELLAKGRNSSYISEELSIALPTVKTYVARIYKKFNVKSKQELIDLIEASRSDKSLR